MVDMLLHGEHGAAWLRRQRRLRSWWRHEQQSVAMALSAAVGSFLEVFGTDFFLALSKEKSFLVVFVGVLTVMVIYFGSAHTLLLFIFVKVLSFVIFCFVIGVLGLGVSFGMVGYLLLLVLVELPLGPPLLKMLLVLG